MRVYSVTARCEACGIVVGDAVTGTVPDVREIPCPRCNQPMQVVGPVRVREADEIDEMVFGTQKERPGLRNWWSGD